MKSRNNFWEDGVRNEIEASYRWQLFVLPRDKLLNCLQISRHKVEQGVEDAGQVLNGLIFKRLLHERSTQVLSNNFLGQIAL